MSTNHLTHHSNARPHQPSALPNKAHAQVATTESLLPWGVLSGALVGLPPVGGGDPSLYKTGLTNLPQPSALGRALCARLAKELVEHKVTPGSSKWRPQTLISLNLLEGAACEYHHNVNTTAVPTSLSDAVVVVGGVRCSCCRPLVGESNGPQVDESENLLASGPEPARTHPAALKPLVPCGKMFTRLIDYEQHLQMASGFAPVHIWLPKHCMYLQGFKGTRGLMELVAAEVYRSPALLSVCDPAAAAAAAAAQQHQLQQGGATPSQDLNDPMFTRMVSHQMPGLHMAVPPPRSSADRQKLARQVQQERRQRAEDEHALSALHPNKRPRHSRDVGLAPHLSPPHAKPQPQPSSLQLQLQRQQLRLYQMQQLRMSEPRVLAQMGPHGVVLNNRQPHTCHHLACCCLRAATPIHQPPYITSTTSSHTYLTTTTTTTSSLLVQGLKALAIPHTQASHPLPSLTHYHPSASNQAWGQASEGPPPLRIHQPPMHLRTCRLTRSRLR